MYKVKLLNKISSNGTKLFGDNYVISEDGENYDAALVRSAKLHDAVFPSELKCIARAGAGVNNIPLDACAEKGIVVFNTPGANANAVKELVICGMLMSSRKIVDGINWAKTLTDDVAGSVEKGKSQFVGPEISGKKLGIVGLGAIGVKLANAAIGMGMEVYGFDPYLSVNSALGMSRSAKLVTDVKTIFENCDYITLHVPATNETRGMINSETIATMKDEVRILNFARGDLVMVDDVITALDSGKIACYVTDFPEEKLISAKNVIALPHLGASTPESEENCAIMAVNQVREYIENGNIVNSVNYPNITVERGGDTRICVCNKNVPNIVSKITNILADENINVENMANCSRGDFAYTIVEVNCDISANLVEKMEAVDGVISVRVIK